MYGDTSLGKLKFSSEVINFHFEKGCSSILYQSIKLNSQIEINYVVNIVEIIKNLNKYLICKY